MHPVTQLQAALRVIVLALRGLLHLLLVHSAAMQLMQLALVQLALMQLALMQLALMQLALCGPAPAHHPLHPPPRGAVLHLLVHMHMLLLLHLPLQTLLRLQLPAQLAYPPAALARWQGVLAAFPRTSPRVILSCAWSGSPVQGQVDLQVWQSRHRCPSPLPPPPRRAPPPPPPLLAGLAWPSFWRTSAGPWILFWPWPLPALAAWLMVQIEGFLC
jgi:hypothetical protein